MSHLTPPKTRTANGLDRPDGLNSSFRSRDRERGCSPFCLAEPTRDYAALTSILSLATLGALTTRISVSASVVISLTTDSGQMM